MRLFILILLLLPSQTIAQQLQVLRSANGIAGSSEKVSISNKIFLARQSIGQQTVSKVSVANNVQLRQGYLQPLVSQSNSKTIEENFAVIYPNPFSDKLNISLPVITNKVSVEIYHISGSLKYKKLIDKAQNIDISTESLQSGAYLLKINTKEETFTHRILKK